MHEWFQNSLQIAIAECWEAQLENKFDSQPWQCVEVSLSVPLELTPKLLLSLLYICAWQTCFPSRYYMQSRCIDIPLQGILLSLYYPAPHKVAVKHDNYYFRCMIAVTYALCALRHIRLECKITSHTFSSKSQWCIINKLNKDEFEIQYKDYSIHFKWSSRHAKCYSPVNE